MSQRVALLDREEKIDRRPGAAHLSVMLVIQKINKNQNTIQIHKLNLTNSFVRVSRHPVGLQTVATDMITLGNHSTNNSRLKNYTFCKIRTNLSIYKSEMLIGKK